MNKKHDKVFTRTAVALEQKWNVKKNFEEAFGQTSEQRNNMVALNAYVRSEIERLEAKIDSQGGGGGGGDVEAHNVDTTAHSDIRQEISDLREDVENVSTGTTFNEETGSLAIGVVTSTSYNEETGDLTIE